jgi:hypothetical protein
MTYIADPRVDAYIGALPDCQAALHYGTGLDPLEGSCCPSLILQTKSSLRMTTGFGGFVGLMAA